MELQFLTRCLYGTNDFENVENTGSISFPIYQTATFKHPGVGQSTGFDYSRLQNPTRQHLEEILAGLENAKKSFAFSSGMAAITALMEIFEPGDELIADADLYGGSIRLFDNISNKNGIKFTRINLSKEDPREYITKKTKAIYIETPTNPMMNVIDIQEMARIAKENNLLLIVDNTFLSPYFQNPIDLGADIVVHSGTKFLGGHNDTLAGFVVTSNEEIIEKMSFIIKTVGSGLAPFDSWLIIRGIKTLALRMEKAQENAFKIVKFLQNNKKVKNVYYPGIEGHKGYEIMKKQARGFGSMISFEVESSELAKTILKSTKLIPFAESLGGTETLLTYPTTQTHADVPEDIRIANGITDSVLRLSVGIEDVEDLIKDLDQAFRAYEVDDQAVCLQGA